MPTEQADVPVVGILEFVDPGSGHLISADPGPNGTQPDTYRVKVAGHGMPIVPNADLLVLPEKYIYPFCLCLMANTQTDLVATVIFLGRHEEYAMAGRREPVIVVAQTMPAQVYVVPERIVKALHRAAFIGQPSEAYDDALEPFLTNGFITDKIKSFNPAWRPQANG